MWPVDWTIRVSPDLLVLFTCGNLWYKEETVLLNTTQQCRESNFMLWTLEKPELQKEQSRKGKSTVSRLLVTSGGVQKLSRGSCYILTIISSLRTNSYQELCLLWKTRGKQSHGHLKMWFKALQGSLDPENPEQSVAKTRQPFWPFWNVRKQSNNLTMISESES